MPTFGGLDDDESCWDQGCGLGCFFAVLELKSISLKMKNLATFFFQQENENGWPGLALGGWDAGLGSKIPPSPQPGLRLSHV